MLGKKLTLEDVYYMLRTWAERPKQQAWVLTRWVGNSSVGREADC